jgi:hypothetical protein
VSIGKLYCPGDEKAVDINYQLNGSSSVNWWGDFVLTEYRRLDDGGRYIIEFEDGRKGMCSIRKKVNKAVVGTPPLYHYHFRGSGLLKKPPK